MVGTLSPSLSGNGLNRAPSVATVQSLPTLGLKELGGYAVAGGTAMPRNRVSRVPAGIKTVCGSAPVGHAGALGQGLLVGIGRTCKSMGQRDHAFGFGFEKLQW
jgi:hypothetical protein